MVKLPEPPTPNKSAADTSSAASHVAMERDSSSSRAGNWTVIAIAVVAFTLAGVAWYFHVTHSQLVRHQWPVETITAIQNAQHVTLLQLEPSEFGERIIRNRRYRVVNSVVLDDKPGLIHFRNALLQDQTYLPSREPPPNPAWTYILQFTNEPPARPVELAFAPDDSVIASADGSHAIVLGAMSKRMQEYLAEILPPQ